ncbi:MAG: hypothetical protein K2O89_03765 [Clostridia bacterium]|nr:hypothetical protein [Clostridia bacterium]
MKLKKFLLILLATVSCVCLGVAFGCKDDEPKEDKFTVNFALSEHVAYSIDGEEFEERQLQINKDENVYFSVVVEDGFLEDTVVVKSNGETLAANGGVYTVHVTSDVTISATVTEDILEGAGTSSSPYLVSSVKDLLFVADMVNSASGNYRTAYYELENDIDCGGAQLDVIGHFQNDLAFFAGVFDGNNHTVSNYKIETRGMTYVGLFGCVQISTATNTAMITNLNLKDFTINANAADDTNLCVGGIVAFSAGANIINCNVEGDINVYSQGYFSYAGGAVGVQQSLTVNASDNMLMHYHCSVENVHASVRITCSGYVLSAGGIVGSSISSHERATAMILNSYSQSSIFGAMRSGGVVGTLDDYSSIANCYSTGYISANVKFPAEVDEHDYFAYAGGIAAYVGLETVISDSFTTCITEAYADNAVSDEGDFYAYASPATNFSNSVAVVNCYAGDDVKATDADFIRNTMHWSGADWVIVDGKYPTTNYESGENAFDIKLVYVGNTVDGNASTEYPYTVNDENGYFPFSSYFDENIKEFYVSDTAGYASYGFFFDEDCTLKVPYGFVPTRSISLYVGFANYSAVKGTYEFTAKNDRTVKITLNEDATYQYEDVRTSSGQYVYDGTKIILRDALFARLSDDVVVGDVAQPWLNYEAYNFVGKVEGSRLSVYDGTYFTDDNPLVFEVSGATTSKNVFVGTWEYSSSVSEKYTFNSNNTWTYSWQGVTKSGSYTVNNDGVASLTGDLTTTATVNESGLLLIGNRYYSLENSLCGNWYSSDSNDYFILDGYGNGLAGSASAIIDGTVYDNLSYVKDGFFDNVTQNPNTYTILSGYALFGYFTYDAETRTVTAMLYEESNAGFTDFTFILLDNYLGEWVGEEEVGGEYFTLLDFNGLGLYKTEGDLSLGYVVINGERVAYESNGEGGSFTYGGTEYQLIINLDGSVTVQYGGDSANLYRKDEMASTPLVDGNGNIYEFNGGGNLSKGGILTVTPTRGEKTEYAYRILSGSIDNLDIVIGLYEGSVSGTQVGSISIKQPKFVLNLNGQNEVSLDLYFTFASKTWAINGLVNSFYMGNFDLTYEATGTFNGTPNVPFVYFPEYNYIYVSYYYYPEESMSATYVQIYLLLLNDGSIAVSTYPHMVSGDYLYASVRDEFFGNWVNTETRHVLAFDGTADSMYRYGVAYDLNANITYYYTRAFGTVYMWVYNDLSIAYTVNLVFDDELTGGNVYLKDGGTRFDRLQLTEVDILNSPIFTATDKDGTSYKIYFDGTIEVGDKSGTFTTTAVDGNETTLEITVDGKRITAIVNHTDKTVTVEN